MTMVPFRAKKKKKMNSSIVMLMMIQKRVRLSLRPFTVGTLQERSHKTEYFLHHWAKHTRANSSVNEMVHFLWQWMRVGLLHADECINKLSSSQLDRPINKEIRKYALQTEKSFGSDWAHDIYLYASFRFYLWFFMHFSSFDEIMRCTQAERQPSDLRRHLVIQSEQCAHTATQTKQQFKMRSHASRI